MKTYDAKIKISGWHKFTVNAVSEEEAHNKMMQTVEDTVYGEMDDASCTDEYMEDNEDGTFLVEAKIEGTWRIQVSGEDTSEVYDKINEMCENEKFEPLSQVDFDITDCEDVTFETLADIYYERSIEYDL